MYRTIKRTPTSLNVNETMEGETIEKMIERRLNNGEPAQDNIMKDLIYQPREEGVNPAYDIRADKMELATNAPALGACGGLSAPKLNRKTTVQ